MAARITSQQRGGGVMWVNVNGEDLINPSRVFEGVELSSILKFNFLIDAFDSKTYLCLTRLMGTSSCQSLYISWPNRFVIVKVLMPKEGLYAGLMEKLDRNHIPKKTLRVVFATSV